MVLGQSTSSTASDGKDWVIAVSVAIPVASCIVLVVVLVVLVLLTLRYLRSRFRRGGMVNFTSRDSLRHNTEEETL